MAPKKTSGGSGPGAGEYDPAHPIWGLSRRVIEHALIAWATAARNAINYNEYQTRAGLRSHASARDTWHRAYRAVHQAVEGQQVRAPRPPQVRAAATKGGKKKTPARSAKLPAGKAGKVAKKAAARKTGGRLGPRQQPLVLSSSEDEDEEEEGSGREATPPDRASGFLGKRRRDDDDDDAAGAGFPASNREVEMTGA